MAKVQELVEQVMDNYYTSHKQGEDLLIIDLQNLVEEGYLVRSEDSPYGILQSENKELKEDLDIERQNTTNLEAEIVHLEALLAKFTKFTMVA